MATHSSSLAWRIPWTEEPGRLYSPQGHKKSDRTKATQYTHKHETTLKDSGKWKKSGIDSIIRFFFYRHQMVSCKKDDGLMEDKAFSSVQFSSVTRSCLTLCNPMDCTPDVPVHHQLSEMLKLMFTELVMPSNHPILCHPLLLPSIFPSIRVFSSESVLCIRWPKCWSFSFSISPSNEYSGLISFRIRQGFGFPLKLQ